MFRPNQVAPFFSMTPAQFSELLREIQVIHSFHQTPMGQFILTEKDFPVIESYIKTKNFFGNKKVTYIHLLELWKRNEEEGDIKPEWIYMMNNI